MPALDQCHDQVVHAFQKAGWQIDGQQYQLKYKAHTVFIDIAASRRINGTGHQILLAEVKCFPNPDSSTREVYIAFGQCLVYRTMLLARGIDTPLYLVIPEAYYEQSFDLTLKQVLKDNQIHYITVNLDTETLVKWNE